MSLNVVSKNKDGELNINFIISSLLVIFFGFIFGIGFSLADNLIAYIFDYLYTQNNIIYDSLFPVLQIVFLFFVVLALAKYSIQNKDAIYDRNQKK